jgi:hypothetical protein
LGERCEGGKKEGEHSLSKVPAANKKWLHPSLNRQLP